MNHIKTNFRDYVKRAGKTTDCAEETLKKAFHNLDSDVLDIPWKEIERALASIDVSARQRLDLESVRNLPIDIRRQILLNSSPALSGACLLSCILADGKVSIAHAGDCRAVLCTKSSQFALTDDHQPSNPKEMSRLEAEHPDEPTVAYRPHKQSPIRVLGGMMPSRAFGDARYKWNLQQQDTFDALADGIQLEPSWRRPKHFYTPPCILKLT